MGPKLIRNGEERRGLRKQIAELKWLLEAYDNHILLPPVCHRCQLISRWYWQEQERERYLGDIVELEARLEELDG